jgi:hypothetical protein
MRGDSSLGDGLHGAIAVQRNVGEIADNRAGLRSRSAGSVMDGHRG